jgi:hypothetical protein
MRVNGSCYFNIQVQRIGKMGKNGKERYKILMRREKYTQKKPPQKTTVSS